jgi:hypothetical protein
MKNFVCSFSYFQVSYFIIPAIGTARFELTTSWSQTRHSTKLSYVPLCIFCYASVGNFAPNAKTLYATGTATATPFS